MPKDYMTGETNNSSFSNVYNSIVDNESPADKAQRVLKLCDMVEESKRSGREFISSLPDEMFVLDDEDDGKEEDIDNQKSGGDDEESSHEAERRTQSENEEDGADNEGGSGEEDAGSDTAINPSKNKPLSRAPPSFQGDVDDRSVASFRSTSSYRRSEQDDRSTKSVPPFLSGMGTSDVSTQTLKAQLKQCHEALLAMRENASFKYRKLEMQYIQIKSALSVAQSNLSEARMELANMSKERTTLREQLDEALDGNAADTIARLQTEVKKQREQMDTYKMERDEAREENRSLREKMETCPSNVCNQHVPKNETEDFPRPGPTNGVKTQEHPASPIRTGATAEKSAEKRASTSWKTANLWAKVASSMLSLESETSAAGANPEEKNPRVVPPNETASPKNTPGTITGISASRPSYSASGPSANTSSAATTAPATSAAKATRKNSLFDRLTRPGCDLGDMDKDIEKLETELKADVSALQDQWKSSVSTSSKTSAVGSRRSAMRKPPSTRGGWESTKALFKGEQMDETRSLSYMRESSRSLSVSVSTESRSRRSRGGGISSSASVGGEPSYSRGKMRTADFKATSRSKAPSSSASVGDLPRITTVADRRNLYKSVKLAREDHDSDEENGGAPRKKHGGMLDAFMASQRWEDEELDESRSVYSMRQKSVRSLNVPPTQPRVTPISTRDRMRYASGNGGDLNSVTEGVNERMSDRNLVESQETSRSIPSY